MKGLNSALKRKSHQNQTDQPTTPQRHTHSSLGHDVSTKLKSQKKMEKKNVVLRKWRVLSFDSFIIIPLPALSPLALHLSLHSTKRRHFTHPVPFSFLISFFISLKGNNILSQKFLKIPFSQIQFLIGCSLLSRSALGIFPNIIHQNDVVNYDIESGNELWSL